MTAFTVIKELVIWSGWSPNPLDIFICSNRISVYILYIYILTVLKSLRRKFLRILIHKPTHPNLHWVVWKIFIRPCPLELMFLHKFWWSSSVASLLLGPKWFWNVCCLSLPTLLTRKIQTCSLMLANCMSCAGLTGSLEVRKAVRYQGSLLLKETEFLLRVSFTWKSCL